MGVDIDRFGRQVCRAAHPVGQLGQLPGLVRVVALAVDEQVDAVADEIPGEPPVVAVRPDEAEVEVAVVRWQPAGVAAGHRDRPAVLREAERGAPEGAGAAEDQGVRWHRASVRVPVDDDRGAGAHRPRV